MCIRDSLVYTVRYNGESYFSDVVFPLTDAQTELAADYASNLSPVSYTHLDVYKRQLLD